MLFIDGEKKEEASTCNVDDMDSQGLVNLRFVCSQVKETIVLLLQVNQMCEA